MWQTFASASLLRGKHLPQWSKKDRRCKSGRFAIYGSTPSALDWVLSQNEGSEADKTAFPSRCASQPFIQYWPSEGHVESNASKHDRYTQTTRTTHMHVSFLPTLKVSTLAVLSLYMLTSFCHHQSLNETEAMENGCTHGNPDLSSAHAWIFACSQ